MGGRSVDALFDRIRWINSCPVNSTRQPSLGPSTFHLQPPSPRRSRLEIPKVAV